MPGPSARRQWRWRGGPLPRQIRGRGDRRCAFDWSFHLTGLFVLCRQWSSPILLLLSLAARSSEPPQYAMLQAESDFHRMAKPQKATEGQPHTRRCDAGGRRCWRLVRP